MGTTNILDLNNRVSELAESYPADKVMMSDGVTSVADALDEVKNNLIKINSANISGTLNDDGNIGITNLTVNDYPIAFLTDSGSSDVVIFFDGSGASGYQKYAHFMTKRSITISGKIIYISGTITS